MDGESLKKSGVYSQFTSKVGSSGCCVDLLEAPRFQHDPEKCCQAMPRRKQREDGANGTMRLNKKCDWKLEEEPHEINRSEWLELFEMVPNKFPEASAHTHSMSRICDCCHLGKSFNRTHTHIHTYIHTYTHIYIYIYIYIYNTYTYTYIFIYVNLGCRPSRCLEGGCGNVIPIYFILFPNRAQDKAYWDFFWGVPILEHAHCIASHSLVRVLSTLWS